MLAYHHWKIESNNNSGVYQDVTGLTPGERVTFTVYSLCDKPAHKKAGPESVELRMESPSHDRLLRLATRTYVCDLIADQGAWSKLQLTATVPTETVRVLIVVNPSKETGREAAIKFDDASLVVVKD